MVVTTQRGLGKGLSALLSENYIQPVVAAGQATVTETPAMGIHTVALHKLHAGIYQPRRQFDEPKLAELAESIRINGIMQPIIVRPSGRQTDQYEIIAGERRWRAAKIAGLADAPVIIRDISDKQALELALIENIQRQDLAPLEEATGYQRLIEEFDYTQEALAATVGKSRSHVANLLRLLGLPDEVKTMLDNGELTMGHARTLLTVPEPVALAKIIITRQLNVRQAEQYGRDAQGREKRTSTRPGSMSQYAPAPYKDPDIIALEETLSDNLGLRVSINDRGQKGQIVLEYDSLSQLDEILQRLGERV